MSEQSTENVAHSTEKDTPVEDRWFDRLSDDEKVARDWWWQYQDWQAGRWIIRDRRRPEYRSTSMDEGTAKSDARRWPGDFYAEPVARPHLPTRVIPPGSDQS